MAFPNILHANDSVDTKAPSPDPTHANPLVKLINLIERTNLAAERQQYLTDSLQYLFPFESLLFYAPNDENDPVYSSITNPADQDNFNILQQQNIEDFHTTDTSLVRGYATAGDWTGPFLRLSYRGGPDSKLSSKLNALAPGDLQVRLPGAAIRLKLKIGNGPVTEIDVPYNPRSNGYELELWGFPGSKDDLLNRLGPKGRESIDAKRLLVSTELAQGNYSNFTLETLKDAHPKDDDIRNYATADIMHPVLPLRVEVGWGSGAVPGQISWDLLNDAGELYPYEFSMCLRGWNNFIKYGASNPMHDGMNQIEFRSLLSNYSPLGFTNWRNTDNTFHPVKDDELRRELRDWNRNSFNIKDHSSPLFGPAGEPRLENFMAVNFIDLDIFRPYCGMGLHRHRDNQEIYLLLEGKGLMIVGDWFKMPDRQRCFEIRTLKPGHLAKIRGGQLHGFLNPSDENVAVFIFGGYD